MNQSREVVHWPNLIPNEKLFDHLSQVKPFGIGSSDCAVVEVESVDVDVS